MEQDGENASVDDLMGLVLEIVPFHMEHNAEPEAVGLLLEVEKLDVLLSNVTGVTTRTCLYLFSCANYLPEPEDDCFKDGAFHLMKVGKIRRHARCIEVVRAKYHRGDIQRLYRHIYPKATLLHVGTPRSSSETRRGTV